MAKSALKKLLLKINSFESQALVAQNPRLWGWKSLISLADNSELIEFFKDTLVMFLGQNVSDEDFSNWVSANSSINNELALQWNMSGDQFGSFLECPLKPLSQDEYLFARIYREPAKAKDNFRIKQERMLQSVGNIPPLYYYNVVPFYSNDLPKIDPKYSNYIFLAEGIQRLLALNIDDTFQKNFAEFMSTNKDKIRKLVSGADAHPRLLGSGLEGVVFSIGRGQILKLFKQKFSFDQALESIKRLHNSPELSKTEAMIYDAGLLGNFGSTPIYFYIMEKMVPIEKLDESYRKPLDQIIQHIILNVKSNENHWETIKQHLSNKNKHSEIKQNVSEGAKKIARSIIDNGVEPEDFISTFTHGANLKPNWLVSLCEEIIMKYLTNRTDLHIGNLGVTGQGELRYFDPSWDPAIDKNIQNSVYEAQTISPPPLM